MQRSINIILSAAASFFSTVAFTFVTKLGKRSTLEEIDDLICLGALTQILFHTIVLTYI